MSRIVRIFYNILFAIFFVASSPYYFLRMWRRGNWVAGFGQRFGKYDPKLKQAITNRHVLWIHAVSVGEVKCCVQLIQALEPRLPNIKIVVSTTTTTGMGELQRQLPPEVSKIYYPIDRRLYVRRALNSLHPEAIILVEAEIWPNFLWRARDMNIPLFLVNARLSERSYRGYKRFGFLFRPLFAAFTAVGAQNEKDAQRLRELGCRPSAVRVAGNLKFDNARIDRRRAVDAGALLHQVGVRPGARVLLGGSTHPGEEAVLADQYLRLREKFPDLFLVLVPRHFERSKEVGRELSKKGLRFVYRDELNGLDGTRQERIDCLLVNTTGELPSFYEEASVVFVGKSLLAAGGQNPIEPGALGKAMVFGPRMNNFAEIARSFVSRKGAVQVRDANELERALGDLLADSVRREELGRNAREVVRENLGATGRTVEMIIEHLDGRQLYITSPAALSTNGSHNPA